VAEALSYSAPRRKSDDVQARYRMTALWRTTDESNVGQCLAGKSTASLAERILGVRSFNQYLWPVDQTHSMKGLTTMTALLKFS